MHISWSLKGLKRSLGGYKLLFLYTRANWIVTIRNFVFACHFLLFLIPQNVKAFSLKLAISSTPNSLSPLYSTDANSQNILKFVHKSLVDFDHSMNVICDACELYSEVLEKGKHILKFRLKKDLKFWDGEEVTSGSIANSLKIFTQEKSRSTFQKTFQDIKKVKIVDKRNFELHYDRFSLENLSNLFLFKIIKLRNDISSFDFENIIGAGDFKIEEQTPVRVSIRRVNIKNELQLNLVDFKIVKDETTLALKLVNGEVDLSVSNISPRKIAWIQNQKSLIKMYSCPSTNVIYLGLNHRKDLLKDIRVRQAISYLIDRKTIQKYKLKNTVDLSNGLFSKGFKEFYNEKRKIDDYNPQMAEALLREAGYVRNKNDGFYYTKQGYPLLLDWKVTSNRSTQEVVEVLAHNFRKYGIEVRVSVQEWGTWMKSMKSGQYDILMAQWIGLTGPEILRQVFHSTMLPPVGNNRGGYINPQFDEMVDRATIEMNLSKRREYYLKAQDLAFDDYAYITLWHPHSIWVAKDCLKNVRPLPTGSYSSILDIKYECK